MEDILGTDPVLVCPWKSSGQLCPFSRKETQAQDSQEHRHSRATTGGPTKETGLIRKVGAERKSGVGGPQGGFRAVLFSAGRQATGAEPRCR